MTLKGVKKLIKRSLSLGKTRSNGSTADNDNVASYSWRRGAPDDLVDKKITGSKFKRTNTDETAKAEVVEEEERPTSKPQRGSLLLRLVTMSGSGSSGPTNNTSATSIVDDSLWTRITRLGVCDEEQDEEKEEDGEHQPSPATYPDPSSLLARVGGASVLNSVVDMFQDMMNEDRALMKIFEGIHPSIMALHQKRFLSMAFTQIPKGISIENTILNQHMYLFQHKGLNAIHFDRMVRHLGAAMEDHNLPQDMIDEAVATMTPLRAIFEVGAQQYPKERDNNKEEEVDHSIGDSYKLSGSDYKISTRHRASTSTVEQSLLLTSTCWKSEELGMFPTEVESMFITWDSRLRCSVFPLEGSKPQRSAAFPMGNGSSKSSDASSSSTRGIAMTANHNHNTATVQNQV